MTAGCAKPPPGERADSQSGSALLAVLVLLGLIAVLASVAARSVSGAALTLGAARASWQAEADLRAGIELGAATILHFGAELRSAEAALDLADRRITVRVTNERGRIDLNAASAPVLAGLFESAGASEDEAEALAASVIEWRGSAAAPALGVSGESAPPTQRRARPFIHPLQLASAPGVSKAFAEAVLPLVTVASASDRIDPYIASDRVLHALPGASAGGVDAFLAARDGNASREAAILLLGARKELMTDDPAPGWRVEITTHRNNQRMRRSEAVIAILTGDSEPYRVLYVLDEREPPSP